ncbi:MAG: hypothetical protein IKA99_05990 [Clostridia bacterium]|nr:hypothetical protein [Clostridia bacterium]
MLIYKKKKGKLDVKREDEENFLKCVNALCFANSEDNTHRIFLTLERLGKKPFLTEDGILCGTDFFFVNFSYDKITIGNIVEAYKKTPQGKRLVYLSVDFSDEAKSFADGFNSRIALIPLSDFFALLQKTSTLPEGGMLPKTKKLGFINLIKATFSKTKAKSLAFYGSILLIMSRFVFFPIWYIITGSIFLIYAITVKFFAPKPIEKTYI